MKKTFALLLLTLVCFNTLAQKIFKEGIITYAVEWELPESMPAGMSEGFPKELNMSVKDSKSFIPMELKMMGQTMSMKVFTSDKPFSMTTCMDMMGQKMGFTMNEEEYKEVLDTIKVNYEYLDFKKKIAGYECRKVIVTMSGLTGEMFVTEDLILPNSQYTMTYKGLKGTPLEFKQNMNGMKVNMKVISIEEKPLDDTLFIIPSGYKLMSMKEARKLGMGN